jgi:conjugal transfer pilus assembly protein TraU
MKHFSWLAGVMLVLLSWMPAQATAASNAGDGRWVNPIRMSAGSACFR